MKKIVTCSGLNQLNDLEICKVGILAKQSLPEMTGHFEDIVCQLRYVPENSMIDPLQYIIRGRRWGGGYEPGVVDVA